MDKINQDKDYVITGDLLWGLLGLLTSEQVRNINTKSIRELKQDEKI